MQVTFDTSIPADVAFVRQILGIAAPAPAAPSTPATPSVPDRPIPDGAPANAYWGPSGVPGGYPVLHAADASRIPLAWTIVDGQLVAAILKP